MENENDTQALYPHYSHARRLVCVLHDRITHQWRYSLASALSYRWARHGLQWNQRIRRRQTLRQQAGTSDGETRWRTNVNTLINNRIRCGTALRASSRVQVPANCQ